MSSGLLINLQNSDGGWPYTRGRSWTEPTVYAILALLAQGETAAARRGLDWILRTQRRDGGWAPQTGVDQSMWVTALVALLPRDFLGGEAHARAIGWLTGTTGEDTTARYRLRQWLLGNSKTGGVPGWPWVPGTAAWVVPTALAVIALDKEMRRNPSEVIRDRVDEGRKFLLGRSCREGGWSNGSGLLPYPETTGVALAALRGVRSPGVAAAVGVAKRFLDDCRSADALNWLRLGLMAHNQLPAEYCAPAQVTFRTIPDACMDLLVKSGRDGGTFWS